MGRPSLHPIEDSADFSVTGAPANPVLFETGDWRLYGHIDNEYSTLAHKCYSRPISSTNVAPQWRWFWGMGDCQNCLKPVPENIQGLWKLHNFDRIAALK